MFKFIILAVWINLALSGAILFSSGKYKELMGGGDKGKTAEKSLVTTALPPISVALIRDSSVVGYLILEVAFRHAEAGKSGNIPFDILFRNAVVNSVYGNPRIDEAQLEHLDLDDLRSGILKAFNKKAGAGIVHDVLIQSVDYRSIEEIRDNKLRRLSQ